MAIPVVHLAQHSIGVAISASITNATRRLSSVDTMCVHRPLGAAFPAQRTAQDTRQSIIPTLHASGKDATVYSAGWTTW